MNIRAFKRRADVGQPGVPLERGMICNNCDVIFDIGELVGRGSCPFCGSDAVSALSRWITRPDLVPAIIDGTRQRQ